MKMENKMPVGVSGSSLFTILLTIAFIVLKLCNVITWSWWWVLSPIWISAAVALVVIFIIIMVVFLFSK